MPKPSDHRKFGTPSVYQRRIADFASFMFADTDRFPVAARLQGKVVGLQTLFPASGPVDDFEFLYADSPAALAILRHSTAHLLARAVIRLFENVHLAFGPSVENGFYYDFHMEHTISEEDFPKIEAEMRRLISQKGTFECFEVPRPQAVRLLEEMDQPLKLEHLHTHLKDTEKLYFYRQGEFLDLTRGPHVLNAELLQHFKLLSVASTHWRGDPQRQPLQRIYGTAFFSEKDLTLYLRQMQEARKRDHRILGRQLELYAIDPRVGSGLVLWLPKGAVIRQQLESLLCEKLAQNGFQRVYSPEMGRTVLYRMTSTNPYAADSAFPRFEVERHDSYTLRSTCGLHHVAIYQNHPRSYRELPLRFFEFGNVCCYEQSGELSGLKRVRGFTRNDTHIFCTSAQLPQEFGRCLKILQENLKTLGFTDLKIQTCFRSDNDVQYSGTPEEWKHWEDVILQECAKLTLPTLPDGIVHPEGPGIDFIAKDSLGREARFGMIHIDFKLPGKESFDLSYVGADNAQHRPMMIHCTPLDSFERLIGILIEHFAGAFPLWLAPEQVKILIVSPKFEAYALEIEEKLRSCGIRVSGDYRSEKIGAKIRRAQLQLVPYMFIIGERETESKTVTIRDRLTGSLGTFTPEEAIAMLSKEIRERTLKHAPGTV